MRSRNQKITKSKNHTKKIVFVFLCFCVFVLTTPALAQVNTGLDQLTATGLGTTDIRVTVGNIIRIFLGLLGVIAITLILIGGFMWMTAAGNEEKIAKAKQLLLNAVIGLAIVLAAFGITSFIIGRFLSATGEGGGEITGTGGGGETSGGRLPADAFTVRSIQPSGDVALRNVTVRLFFTKSVDPKTVDGNITVVKIADSVGVAGKLAVDGSVVTFTPDAACPEPNVDRKCFDASTGYRVEATARAVQSTDGKELLCGIGGVCKAAFKSGTLVDVASPAIILTNPADGAFVSADAGVPIDFTATDDSGVAYAEVSIDGQKLGVVTPPGATPLRWNGGTVWDTTGKAAGSSHTISAKAFDIDTNTPGDSNVVTVKLRAAHCFNGAQDKNLTPTAISEEGIDCGGTDCGACTGASCTTNDQCASDACSAGTCVDYPTITRVAPLDGAPGNLITIFGHGFGATQGKGSLVFLGKSGVLDDTPGAIPQACGTGDLWRDDRIIVAVPDGAATGALKVTNDAGFWDDTANARGGQYFFAPSATVRPGLCSVAPAEGTLGMAVTVSGVNFGTTKGKLLIGNTDAGSDTVQWANTSIRGGAVPNLVPGSADVMVVQGNEQSNPISFRVKETVGAPRIDTIAPAVGPTGTYVTLQGSNFGTAGTAYFVSAAGTEKVADVTFPAACSADYWAQTAVTVKVPSDLAAGAYTVFVKRDNAIQSNSKDFAVTGGSAVPGLCRLNPDNGPTGLSVVVIGDRLGDAQGKNGKVKFNAEKGQETERRSAPIASWSTQSVVIAVPLLATTGQVQLVDSAGTLSSNTLPFEIKDCRAISGCGKGEQCCGDGACREAGTCAESAPQCTFAWKFTTGVGAGTPVTGGKCPDPKAVNGGCGAGTDCVNGQCLDALPHVVEQESCTTNTQSPSPYRETKNACMNAGIALRFTRNMQDASLVKTDNITLVKCNVGDAFKPTECGTANLGVVFDAVTGWIAHDTEGEGVAYTSRETFTANTWYRVRIASSAGGVQSQEGKLLDGDNDGKEGGDYTWTFHTASAPCAVDSVRVTPVQATIDRPTKTQDFTSIATAANCNILQDADYAWTWSSDKEPGSVTLAPKNPEAQTIATPKNETPANDPARVRADIGAKAGAPPLPAIPDAKLYRGALTIAYPAPSVIAWWPGCDAACSNATIGAEFSSDIDTTTIAGDAVQVYMCQTKDCLVTELTPSRRVALLAPPLYNDRTMDIVPAAPLPALTYFRVVLRNVITGVNGKALTDLNFDATGSGANNAYAWIFKTKAAPAECAIDRTGVEPANRTVYVVGTPSLFSSVAYGRPDACSPQTGERLNPFTYNWQWETSAPTLARVTNQNVLPQSVRDENIDPEQQVIGDGQQRDTHIIAGANGKQNNALYTLQCGFTKAEQCAAADPITCSTGTGCGIGSDTCCGLRPRIVGGYPRNDVNVCPNVVPTVEFDQVMDEASMSGNVIVAKGAAPCPASGDCPQAVKGAVERVVVGNHTTMKFTPTTNLAINTPYTLEVRSAIMNTHGIAVGDAGGRATYTFTTGSTVCRIASVEVAVSHADKPAPFLGNTDMFMCGRDDCADDMVPAKKAGNQHFYTARALDVGRHELNADYAWTRSGDDIFTAVDADKETATVTPNAKNGTSDVTVVATGAHKTEEEGVAAGTVGVTAFMCENPWPSFVEFPWTDAETNFSLFYCRDSGSPSTSDDLPALYTPVPIAHPAGNGCSNDTECSAGYYCAVEIPRRCTSAIYKDFLLPTQTEATDNNGKRRRDVNTIANALLQYAGDHANAFPSGITGTQKEICKTGADACTNLVDLSVLTQGAAYLISLPEDPNGTCNPNGTCYEVKLSSGKVTVVAPDAEHGETISVTR